MFDYKTFYDPSTINIFSDASVVYKEGISFTCAGAVAIRGGDMTPPYYKETKRISRGTNNYGEIDAILLAVLLARDAYLENNRQVRINIFSDSQISVSSMREWCFTWFKKSTKDSTVFRNSEGVPVANQEVMKKIMYYIVQYQIPIYFYHIKGHTVYGNGAVNFKVALNTFANSNGFLPKFEIMHTICIMNDVVDNLTRDYLKYHEDLLSIPPKNTLYSYDYPLTHEEVYLYHDLIVHPIPFEDEGFNQRVRRRKIRIKGEN